MKHYGEFSGHRHHRPLFGILAATLCELLSVSPEDGVRGERAQDVVGTAYQRSPEHLVALPGDTLLGISLAGVVGARRQSQVGSHRAAFGETLRVLQGQDKRKSCQRSHSRHLPQKLRLRIMFCGQPFYAPVIILDLLGERADGLVSTMGPRASTSSEGRLPGTFLWKLGVEHLGKRYPKDFTVPRTLG